MRMLLAVLVVVASATMALAQFGSRSHGYDDGFGHDYGSTSYPLGHYVTPHYNSHGEYVGGYFSAPGSNNLNQNSNRPHGIGGPRMPTLGIRPPRY